MIEKGVVVRGDLHKPDIKVPVISIGRFCIFNEDSSLIPPSRVPPQLGSSESTEEQVQKYQSQITPETGKIHFPVKMGSCVYIGKGSTVEAAQIGSFVYIGENCTIGEFAIIKDCVVIEDNTVIPPYVTVSSFSRMSGRPGNFIEDLPESTEQVLEVFCRKCYAGILALDPPL